MQPRPRAETVSGRRFRGCVVEGSCDPLNVFERASGQVLPAGSVLVLPLPTRRARPRQRVEVMVALMNDFRVGDQEPTAVLTIGDLAEQTGLTPAVLRVWE